MSRSRRRFVTRRGFLVAVVVLVLVTGATAAAARTGAKPSGEPVRLMVIYEKDQGAAIPGVPDGAIAAAKALNRKDGIGGRPVKIIVCDTHNDPNTAAECGRKAVEQKVVALVGQSTAQSSNFLPLMVKNKIPSVGALLGGPADATSAAMFPIHGGGADGAGVTGLRALPVILHDQAHASHISVAYVDLPGAGAATGFMDDSLKRFGLKTQNSVSVPLGAPDMSPYVAAALKDGTDAVVVLLADQDAVNFTQALRQADPGVAVALAATGEKSLIKALGKDTKDIYGAVSTVPLSVKNPGNQQYVANLKAAGVKEPSAGAKNAWASVMVLAKVAEGIPDLTAAALYDKLPTVSGVELGFEPPVQFVKGGVSGLPRIFNPCLLATKIKKGKEVPVTGKFFDVITGEECPLTG